MKIPDRKILTYHLKLNIMTKQYLILVFALITYSLAYGQSISPDEKAIIDLVKAESKAYLQHDFDTWSSYWIHEPYTHHNYTTSSYHKRLLSWDELQRSCKEEFKALPNPNFDIEKSDFKIQVFGNTAIANFKETYLNLTSNDKDVWNANNNAFFEKKDGEWKIVGYNIVNETTFKASDYDVMANLNLVGNMLMDMNKTEEALRVFDLCMEIQPESCEKYNKLGEVFMNMGKEELARQYFKKCLIIEPKNEVAIGKIGQIEAK